MTDVFEVNSDLLFTDEDVNDALIAEYRRAGLTHLTKDGTEVPDKDGVKQKTYDVVTAKLVNDRTEMSNKAKTFTPGELQALVFPGSPGSDPRQPLAALTPLERAVREQLRRDTWNLTNPNRNGYIQKRLGKEGRTEILVRTPVQRGVDEVIGVFITNDAELIMNESVQPVIEKVLTAAREVRLFHDQVIANRHSELTSQIMKALTDARKRIAAELALTGGNGATRALPAATPDGDAD